MQSTSYLQWYRVHANTVYTGLMQTTVKSGMEEVPLCNSKYAILDGINDYIGCDEKPHNNCTKHWYCRATSTCGPVTFQSPELC
jgi:hypothetical protein